MSLFCKKRLSVLSIIVPCIGFLSGCSSVESKQDPLERINRPIANFNDTLDRYTLKPAAKGYKAVAPEFVETGVHNFFRNIGDVGNMANNLLQGKFSAAKTDGSRLLINTTVGVFGFVDAGTKLGFERNDEDFGQTLAAWGVSSGPYVVLPFFGPSTIRDASARIVDYYATPFPYINGWVVRNSMMAVQAVDERASFLAAENIISGDRYIFIRNAYLQNREFKIKDGLVIDDF